MFLTNFSPFILDPLYPDCPDCDGYWIPFRSGKLDIPVAEENPAEDEVTAAEKSPKEKAEEGSPISEVGQQDSGKQSPENHAWGLGWSKY